MAKPDLRLVGQDLRPPAPKKRKLPRRITSYKNEVKALYMRCGRADPDDLLDCGPYLMVLRELAHELDKGVLTLGHETYKSYSSQYRMCYNEVKKSLTAHGKTHGAVRQTVEKKTSVFADYEAM